MKTTDRAVLSGLVVVLLLAAFYFLVLAPKRETASKLGDDIAALESQIAEQEQTVAFAEEARKEYPKYYGSMVVLGKAAPEQADTASMLVQVSGIADRTSVEFRSLALTEGGGESAGETAAAAPAPATPAPESGTPPAEGAPAAGTPAEGAQASTDATSTPTTATAAPAIATESAAATLPIGATVGPAGLPTLPYSFEFDGTFFDVADFMSGIDDQVHARDEGTEVDVDGRLMTVDGFSLLGGAPGSNPNLKALFAVTTYTVPAQQGLTLGASPSAPAAPLPGQPQTTPASTVTAP